MKRALLVVLVLGCDKGEPPKPPPPPIPSGPYVVRMACEHERPLHIVIRHFARSTYDLGARTVTRRHFSQIDNRPKPEWAAWPGLSMKTESLATDRVIAIHAAVENVLRGGPYKPEHAPVDGMECILVIDANGKKVFEIAKSTVLEPDAVSALVRTLAP